VSSAGPGSSLFCSERMYPSSKTLHCVFCTGDLHSPRRILWGAEIGKNPPSVQYEEVMNSDAGVGEWTKLIVRYFTICPVILTDQCSLNTDSALLMASQSRLRRHRNSLSALHLSEKPIMVVKNLHKQICITQLTLLLLPRWILRFYI
jgi:hypothetical protein